MDKNQYVLPELGYDYAALEPHYSARMLELHHGKHHASYVAGLNAALANFPQLHERSALWLLLNLNEVPEAIRTTVHNNAGGHVNHRLFWRSMSPARDGKPEGALAEAIERRAGVARQPVADDLVLFFHRALPCGPEYRRKRCGVIAATPQAAAAGAA